MVMKKTSKYRLMRLKKLASKYGYQIINGEMHSFCYLCDEWDKLENFTIDHYKARYNGGTNRLSNLRICCKECNEKKAENERPALPHSRIYYLFIRPIRKFFRRKIWEIKRGEICRKILDTGWKREIAQPTPANELNTTPKQ